MAEDMEASPGTLAAAILWGNPFTDVPELGSNSLVVTDGDPDAARTQALALTSCFWACTG